MTLVISRFLLIFFSSKFYIMWALLWIVSMQLIDFVHLSTHTSKFNKLFWWGQPLYHRLTVIRSSSSFLFTKLILSQATIRWANMWQWVDGVHHLFVFEIWLFLQRLPPNHPNGNLCDLVRFRTHYYHDCYEVIFDWLFLIGEAFVRVQLWHLWSKEKKLIKIWRQTLIIKFSLGSAPPSSVTFMNVVIEIS